MRLPRGDAGLLVRPLPWICRWTWFDTGDRRLLGLFQLEPLRPSIAFLVLARLLRGGVRASNSGAIGSWVVRVGRLLLGMVLV